MSSLSPEEVVASHSEYGSRKLVKFSAGLVSVIAALWSLFQLALPKFLLLNSEIVRCIHLAFAITLVYFCFPVIKNPFWREKIYKKGGKLGSLFIRQSGIPFFDYIFALISAGAALYLAFDYEGVGARAGAPILRDMIVGSILILFLLEAARRSLGPALAAIASIFIIYSFFSEKMPDIIAFKNASLSKIVGKLALGGEGIFGVPLDVSAQTVFLFVLFGAMLDRSGGGQYFIQLAFSLLGRFRGGPAKAAVLASGLTGMVSGSSIANTVTTGTFTIPLMKRTGFPGFKAAAVEVAASTNGQLMPPIMGAAAFIIAEYCNLTYFEVIKAAFVPAVASYIALIYVVHIESLKIGIKGMSKQELPKFWPTFLSGIHYVIPLCFLLYQLVIQRRSAMLSAYYAIISLALLIILHQLWDTHKKEKNYVRALKASCSDIWNSLVMGGKNMMSIGVAVAAAGIIVGIVTLGLGGVITDLIDLLSGGNIFLLLIITAIVSLLLGMGLPTTANYIVMASLTVPAIVELSGGAGLTVPLVAAHLFCFYFGILADDTPPVGLAAYAAGAIAKENPIKVGVQGFRYDMRTAILPFMFIFNTNLLLIDIHSWLDVAIIFLSTIVAMFAFVGITQNFLNRKNRWYEIVLLIISAIVLFRTDYMNQVFDLGAWGWNVLGIGLFMLVYFSQLLKCSLKS